MRIVEDRQLFLMFSKCEPYLYFFTFLVNVVSTKGIRVDCHKNLFSTTLAKGSEWILTKTYLVQHWPIPTSPKNNRSFLELCSYYRRFIEVFHP